MVMPYLGISWVGAYYLKIVRVMLEELEQWVIVSLS